MITVGLARIGNEPVVRYTADSKPILDLSLAYDYGRKDQSGKRPTQWITATLFGDRAEKIATYINKGDQISVQLTDLHIETYDKKDGTQGVSLKARIADLEFVSKRSTDQQRKPAHDLAHEDMPF